MSGALRCLLVCLLTIACDVAAVPPAVLAADPTDLQILKMADESRGNTGGVAWNVRIVSNEKNDYRQQDFFVQARGFDALAEVTAPPRSRGNRILMVKRNMWFSTNELSRPVPISQRQKLQGLAAYGDIPATNYTEDYRARRVGVESVDDEECIVFDLVAKDKKRSTYDKIRYWVSKKRLLGLKSEFYTVSGMLVKSAVHSYDNAIKVRGKLRPFISRIEFHDALRPKLETSMLFTAPSLRPIPSHVFNVNFMTE